MEVGVAYAYACRIRNWTALIGQAIFTNAVWLNKTEGDNQCKLILSISDECHAAVSSESSTVLSVLL